jgi:hypothetical protein
MVLYYGSPDLVSPPFTCNLKRGGCSPPIRPTLWMTDNTTINKQALRKEISPLQHVVDDEYQSSDGANLWTKVNASVPDLDQSHDCWNRPAREAQIWRQRTDIKAAVLH